MYVSIRSSNHVLLFRFLRSLLPLAPESSRLVARSSLLINLLSVPLPVPTPSFSVAARTPVPPTDTSVPLVFLTPPPAQNCPLREPSLSALVVAESPTVTRTKHDSDHNTTDDIVYEVDVRNVLGSFLVYFLLLSMTVM